MIFVSIAVLRLCKNAKNMVLNGTLEGKIIETFLETSPELSLSCLLLR